MLGKLPHTSSIEPQSYTFFRVFAVITLCSILLGVATDMLFLAGLPVFLLLVFLTIVDFQKVFYLLVIALAISTHVRLPGGFALDLPSEPLMIGLMFVYIIHSIKNFSGFRDNFFRHPITTLLILHWLWTFITCFSASHIGVSAKFFLAKTWYIFVFYFLAKKFLQTEKDVKRFFWLTCIPLALVVASVVIRHAAYDFSFKDVYRVIGPFYGNHVIYASHLVLFIPFIWFVRQWYKKSTRQWWFLLAAFALFFIAIQLSYRRAAILVLYMSVPAYYMIRFKLTRIALMLGTVIAIGLVTHLTSHNQYMEYAPNFEKTITHQNFDNLVEATAKGEDISTMERVYRWVAAGFMIQEKPLMGFGPGNFYFCYRPYTVTSFETYVSHNPEKSGIHNYYMMVLVEQGVFGFLIFLALTFYALIKGEAIYHQTQNKQRQQVVMMALLSLIIICVLSLINDVIETDKIGTYYFMNLAILVNMDLRNQKEKRQKIADKLNP